MTIQYTESQIRKKLIDQGYSPERAQTMAQSIGDVEKQSGNLVPNLAESSAFLAAKNLADKHIKGTGKLAGAGRLAAAGVPANLAGIGASLLTGNNFYEQASMPQLVADLGGQIGGAMLGEKLAKGAAKGLGDAAKQKLVPETARRLAEGVIGPKLAARALGSTVGSALGPLGSIAGGAIAGWLLPKLFANENEKFIDPDAGVGGGTLAALAAAGTLASPVGRPVRKLIADNTQWAEPVTKYPKRYAKAAHDMFIEPLGKKLDPILGDAKTAYKWDKKGRIDDIATSYRANNKVLPDVNTFGGTGKNIKETLAGIQALGSGAEELGYTLGNMYKNRKKQP